MNPDQPSREEIELRLTALLLGELPDAEAALLRYTIAQDADLQKLHDELAATIILVREVEKNPADAPTVQAEPLKLSAARREKLLAHFQTPRQPDPLFWLKPINIPKVPRLIEVLVVLAVVAVLAAMMLPALSKAKSKAMRPTVISGRAAKTEAAPVQLSYKTWSGDNADRYPASAAASGHDFTAAIPPASVMTVAPEPVLTPPPTQIILPLTESPASVGQQMNLSGSQNNFTLNSATLGVSHGLGGAVGGGSGGGKIQNSGVVVGVINAFAGAGDFRSSGQNSGSATTPSGTSALAWFDSEANRSKTESTPKSAGEEYRRNVPAQTTKFGFDLAATVAPKEKLPTLALNEPASVNFQTSQLDAKKSDPLLVAGLSDRDGADVVVGNKFYRQSARERSDSNGSIAPATAPAKPIADVDGRYNFFAADNISTQQTGESKQADKSGRSEVAAYGVNADSGKVAVNAGNLALGVPQDSFNTGLAKDDVAALRYLTTTNAVVLNGKLAERQRKSAATVPTIGDIPVSGKLFATSDRPLPKQQISAPIPQPEILCHENNFSTFSLNVSDVSFKLAAASLERGQMPDAASIRTEEFINAFDYRDPEAKWDSASSLSSDSTGKMPVPQPLAFASERARYPFAQNRDLLRFSIKTAAAGRPAGRALNLVLLLDKSGSMERADRVAIIREALRVLGTQLQPQDKVSVVTFARTARLWADGLPGDKAGETLKKIGGLTPEGGTNLEEAMRLAYETARRHYLANGMNRVVLLTDGAANLGNVSAAALKEKVEAQRKQGIALDCFGIGFEDFNDDLLQQLSSNGDGRYAFLNSPEDASKEFAAKLAGAFQVAASDVKVQVEFNPQRVISYRQIGYAKHQLTKEQFRDNTVDAAEIAAQEAGNALYTVETKPDGIGPVATVRVRYKIPGTTDYRERSWDVAYAGNAVALAQSSPAMRLAATASAFSEWLAASPFAQEVTPDELQKILNGVPQIYGADERPKKLEWMIRQAKSVSGK